MKKQGFIRGSAILMSMIVITKTVGIIYKIPLTNLLGGGGMAYYSGTFAIFAPVYALWVSGITPTVARLTADCIISERYTDALCLRRTARLIFFVLSVIPAALLILLSGVLSKQLLGDQSAYIAVSLTAPMLVISALISVERGFCEGMQDMQPTALSEILEAVFKAVSGIALAFFTMSSCKNEYLSSGTVFGTSCASSEQAARAALPYTAAAAVAGHVLAAFVSYIFVAYAGRRKSRELKRIKSPKDRKTRRHRTVAAELLSFSFPISVAASISTLSITIDLITITRGIKIAAAKGFSVDGITENELPGFVYGSYSGLVLMLAGLAPTFTAMLGKSSLPLLTAAKKRGNKEQMKKLLEGIFLAASIIACPFAAAMAALPKETLCFIFSGRTAEIAVSTLPLAICSAGVLFSSSCLPCLSVLQTLRQRKAPIVIMTVGATIRLILNLTLISKPRFNISGAALSYSASQAVMFILAFAAVVKASGVFPKISKVFAAPIFAGVLCAVTARIAFDLFADHLSLRLAYICAAAFAGGVYIASLVLLDAVPIKNAKVIAKHKAGKVLKST